MHPGAREHAAHGRARRGQRLLDPGDPDAGLRAPGGRDVGPDPHAVDDAHRRAERTAAAEQEGALAGAGAHRVEPGAQPLRAAEPRIEGVGLHGGRVEEVELQVVEAQRPQLAEDGLEMRAHLGPARVEHVHGRRRGSRPGAAARAASRRRCAAASRGAPRRGGSPATTQKGAVQIPAVKPAARISAASGARPRGNFAFVSSQSPIARW